MFFIRFVTGSTDDVIKATNTATGSILVNHLQPEESEHSNGGNNCKITSSATAEEAAVADEEDLEEQLLNERFSCICDADFADYAHFEQHTATCARAKVTPHHSCEVCRKTFYSKSGYAKHKRLHTGSFKFRCRVCRKGFFDRTHLRAHMDSSHSKVRRFECKFCCKSFFWKHHLKRHLGTCGVAKVTKSSSVAAILERNSSQEAPVSTPTDSVSDDAAAPLLNGEMG